jgi:hypothetical protein
MKIESLEQVGEVVKVEDQYPNIFSVLSEVKEKKNTHMVILLI